MRKNLLLKLFVILNFYFLVNGNALAFYKPKLMVVEFDDPKNWDKKFSPGKILSQRLENLLKRKNQFQILSAEKIEIVDQSKLLDSQILDGPLPKIPKGSNLNQGLKNMKNMENQRSMNMYFGEPKYRVAKMHKYQRAMEIDPAIHYYDDGSSFDLIQIQDSNNQITDKQDSITGESIDNLEEGISWPTKMGNAAEKASLYKLIGQIIKFDQNILDSSVGKSDKAKTSNFENAELEINIQLIQNKTGRVVREKTFRAISKSGKRPFSADIDLHSIEKFHEKPSSMGLAISNLTEEIIAFTKNTISSFYLEGEIISIKNEDVLINIGRQNGIEVGDKFRVFFLSLKLADPFTAVDLGDNYMKMGVIRIVETMLGFSKAMVITGEKLSPGNLVKSFKKIKNSYNEFNSDLTSDDFNKEISWREFRRN